MTKPQSNCCNAPLITNQSDEGTGYYSCSSCQKPCDQQNQPQLSAEMEKRFSKIMLEWIESQWKIEQAHRNGEPYTRMKFEADASKVENELKHFLATALEEQRQEYVRKVELRKKIEPWIADPNRESLKIEMDAYNQAIKYVLAILNGKE